VSRNKKTHGPEIIKNISKLVIVLGKPLFYLLAFLIIFFYAFSSILIRTAEVLIKITKVKIIPVIFAVPLTLLLHFKNILFPKRKRKVPKKTVKKITEPILKIRFKHALVAYLIFLSSVGIYFFWQSVTGDLPSPKTLIERDVATSTKIYDRNQVLLYNIYKDENRTLVSLDQIPIQVRLATLAIEDAEFYKHPGFSLRGILRATIKNLKEKDLTGGSTITQQLVKNAPPSPEKTFNRKIREIILAVRVEMTFSKDEILEMYLNEVSYGGTAYGIQEASRVYFGKDVSDLSLGEAALLAGLPKSPTQYSPFGSNPDLAISRQKEVLNLMKINVYITEEQEKEALKEEIVFADNRIEIKAPHFVMFVREHLEKKHGKELVETGGLSVTTTLDYRIQQLAEEVVKEEVEKLENLKVGNGAVLVVNPRTGEILAMVGSKDYFDIKSDGNVNVTTRPRQPGSSIKIVNYAYALSNGYNPSTILKDTPVKFRVTGQPDYTPRNYDGGFRGYLTLRSALSESRNIPAVKVLATYGVDKMIEMGRKMGITTWEDPKNYGLSLTLGGCDVKLIDLAQAYSVIANYGNRVDFDPIISIKNHQNVVLEENPCIQETVDNPFSVKYSAYSPQSTKKRASELIESTALADSSFSKCQSEQVLDPRVAFLITDILKDNTARAPAFGFNSLLSIPGHSEVAVKTGTSNDLRDNLAIGFNQNYLVAVWVGNNDNSPMSRIASGVTGATPIFNKIISALLADDDNTNSEWVVPEGVVRIPYCSLTNTLPCEGCPISYEYFLEENTPTSFCTRETIEKITEQLQQKDTSQQEGQILDSAASTR